MSGASKSKSLRGDQPPPRTPFRAVDVLSGSIDKRHTAKPVRTRKQISAQLEPVQIQLLGELHARLNAAATERIEKSDLVGLGIELLAAAIERADRESAPAPDNNNAKATVNGRHGDVVESPALRSVDAIRSYLRTYVRDRDG
jgi:hypothetical protein